MARNRATNHCSGKIARQTEKPAQDTFQGQGDPALRFALRLALKCKTPPAGRGFRK